MTRSEAGEPVRPAPSIRAAFPYAVAAALPLASSIEPYAAGALILALALVAPRVRRLPPRAWYPIIGFLAAGGAALLVAWLQPLPALAGAGYDAGQGLVVWAWWLGVAALLAVALERLDVRHAAAVGLGSIAAAIANAGVGLYQVAWLGQTQSLGFTYHPNLAAAAALVALGGVVVGWRPLWRRGLFGRLALLLGLGAALVALVITGSRSGMVGLAVGAAWWLLLVLPRVRLRPLLVTVAVVGVVGAGALVGDRMARGPASPNLLTNSGFEQGLTSWSLQGAGKREVVDGSPAVLLSRGAATAYVLLTYAPTVQVGPGEAMRLSIGLHPSEPAPEGAERIGVVVAIDAVDDDRATVARLGVDGWAPSAKAVPGGRPKLPTPDAGWSRVEAQLPPVPEGATGLTLTLLPSGQGAAQFGWVDSLQMTRSAAATKTDGPVEFVEVARGATRSAADAGYVPGQGPGLFGWAQPAVRRLEVFANDPTGASGGRLAMWLLGVDLAQARPVLGYGPGSEVAVADTFAASRIATPLDHFHSLYVKVLLEGGVVLLGALLVLLGGLVAGLSRAALARRQGALAAAATLAALMAQSVFDPVLTLAGVAGGLWVVMSVASPLSSWLHATMTEPGG